MPFVDPEEFSGGLWHPVVTERLEPDIPEALTLELGLRRNRSNPNGSGASRYYYGPACLNYYLSSICMGLHFDRI